LRLARRRLLHHLDDDSCQCDFVKSILIELISYRYEVAGR
jgi:hypothetical protein